MLHCSQTSGLSSFTLHSSHAPPLIPKATNLKTQNHKPLFLVLFKPPPPPPPRRRLQVNCNINGSLLSPPEKGTRRADEETQNLISSTDYLMCSLNLSPESAAGFTRFVVLKSTDNADSVVALFRGYGFTSSHLAQIFAAFPRLLLSDPLKTLKPKLDCFVENGISGDILHQVLTSDPHILRISLRRRIIPCLQFLREFYGTTDDIATHLTLRRGTWALRNFSDTTVPNVNTLLAHGVPKPNIVRLLAAVPSFSRPTEEFSAAVKEVSGMGFRPRRVTFVRALNACLAVSKEKRAATRELFKSFGWTEEQLRSMFLKQPKHIVASEEKLKESLELFITKLNWSIDDVTKYFTLLTCSIDKRITPRLSVLEILHSRGLVEKTSYCSACHISESVFLKMYVTRHKQLPHLLEVYKKNMGS